MAGRPVRRGFIPGGTVDRGRWALPKGQRSFSTDAIAERGRDGRPGRRGNGGAGRRRSASNIGKRPTIRKWFILVMNSRITDQEIKFKFITIRLDTLS